MQDIEREVEAILKDLTVKDTEVFAEVLETYRRFLPLNQLPKTPQGERHVPRVARKPEPEPSVGEILYQPQTSKRHVQVGLVYHNRFLVTGELPEELKLNERF
jgi:hypothetical protein